LSNPLADLRPDREREQARGANAPPIRAIMPHATAGTSQLEPFKRQRESGGDDKWKMRATRAR
jgi:hypothetical protein